jgi:putative endonuclease
MVQKRGFVYILASKPRGTLYIGVTSDLIRRVYEHKSKLIDGFTKKYQVDRLVYYEMYESIIEAIQRESNLKNWQREWKLQLIEESNLYWIDLYPTLM